MTDILELIDNAIEDWHTSDDAMRWTPEPITEPDHGEFELPSWIMRDLYLFMSSNIFLESAPVFTHTITPSFTFVPEAPLSDLDLYEDCLERLDAAVHVPVEPPEVKWQVPVAEVRSVSHTGPPLPRLGRI